MESVTGLCVCVFCFVGAMFVFQYAVRHGDRGTLAGWPRRTMSPAAAAAAACWEVAKFTYAWRGSPSLRTTNVTTPYCDPATWPEHTTYRRQGAVANRQLVGGFAGGGGC